MVLSQYIKNSLWCFGSAGHALYYTLTLAICNLVAYNRDMTILTQILISTTLVSGISLAAAGLLSFFPRFLNQITIYLAALAAGTMIGTSFLHLIPEAVERLPAETALFTVLASFIGFFIVEKSLHLHHHHRKIDEHCDDHTFGWLNLLGDALHNFIDGILIGGAFLINPALGWLTTLAIMTEEIPQELGDFGVLLFSGFTRRQALLANFAIALLAISGGVLAYSLGTTFTFLADWLIPMTAGGFLYIATVDLIPEIQKHKRKLSSLFLVIVFAFGVGMLPLLETVTAEWLSDPHAIEESLSGESTTTPVEVSEE